MVTLILVVLVVSLLVLVHEWGHFYSARKLGVKVEEFGFGFPPRLVSILRKGIRYSFNLFPLGGFVKIYGEHGEGEGETESFVSRPIWQRAVILVSGVFMNVVLAWVLFSASAAIGVPRLSDVSHDEKGIPVSVIVVLPGSPAEKAGLKIGDQILEMRAPNLMLRVEKEEDIRDFAYAYRGEEIVMILRRGAEIEEVKIIPRSSVPAGEEPLGIAMGRLVVRKIPWYLAPFEGAKTTGRTLLATLDGLKLLFEELVLKGNTNLPISGPVGIFLFANDSRSLGVSFFLQFVGVLSINLAILNFLPIPALDGGRIFFLLIEKIKGRKVSPYLENIFHTVGFFVLIALMVLVTYKDIARIL